MDRAKLLDQMVDAAGKLNSKSSEAAAWSKEIVALDADNKAGLKTKHELKFLTAECAKFQKQQSFDKVEKNVKKILALPGLTGQQKQGVYMIEGECRFGQKDFAGAVASLGKALAADKSSDERRIQR